MKTIIYTYLLLLSVMYATGNNHPVKEKKDATNTLNFVNFDAVKNGNRVKIFWSIKSEINYTFFVLERSRNGIDFEKVSKIDASNNNNSATCYIETDYKPLQGISYYRLRMTNSSSKKVYSHTVVVNYYSDKNNTNIIYNTSNGDLNMSLRKSENSETLVVLRDLSGNEYYSKVLVSVQNSEIIGIDTEKKLTSGTYMVTASSNNLLCNQKISIR